MLSKLAYLTLCRSIQLLALLTHDDAAKDLEILVLRHQLTVLRRQTPRPKLEPTDRAPLAAISRILPQSRWSCSSSGRRRCCVGLVAGACTYPHQPGRPPLDDDVQQLIVRLAKENPRWGYQRIQGELLRLRVEVSATAIRTTLRRHGLDPAPRSTATTWRAFLRQQAASERGRTGLGGTSSGEYRRFRIATRFTPRSYLSPRLWVRVWNHRQIGLVLKELVQQRGNRRVALDRPCV